MFWFFLTEIPSVFTWLFFPEDDYSSYLTWEWRNFQDVGLAVLEPGKSWVDLDDFGHPISNIPSEQGGQREAKEHPIPLLVNFQ